MVVVVVVVNKEADAVVAANEGGSFAVPVVGRLFGKLVCITDAGVVIRLVVFLLLIDMLVVDEFEGETFCVSNEDVGCDAVVGVCGDEVVVVLVENGDT